MAGRRVAGGGPNGAVRRAAYRVVEQLEGRALLSGNTVGLSGAVLAAVPVGLSARSTDGRLELAVKPQAGLSTPSYVEFDTNPTVAADGSLAPFATAGPTGVTPAIMRRAYGVDQIMFGSVQGDGTGQTIAIVDAYDYPTAANDLHAFDVAFSLPDPPSFIKVNQTGGTTLPSVDTTHAKGNDWEVEEALDIEWAHAMAPGANIVLVEATSNSDADLMTAAVGYARTIPGAVAVSMSFGRSESSSELALDSTFTTPAGHTGVTFLASTGDYAAPAGYPSYSPNVVAVGGTTLTTDASGNYVSESAWSSSGGGISAYETQPAYQKGFVTQSTTYRTAPDIALDANPSTGASIYDTYDFGTTTPWLTVGGTSLSAPAVAGMIAVADQGRTLAGGTTLNGVTDTLPKLYAAAAADFHDITTGSNGYAAGVGYDLVTGRGSPIANVLIPALAASGPYVTSATPTGVLSAGPSSVTFTFSGAMDTTSFNPAVDIDAFTGPGGADLRSTVTSYNWLSNTSLTVNFTTASPSGTYAMTIGPAVLSASGQAMDQNQNGVVGESADTFTDSFVVDPNPLAVTGTTPAANGLFTGSTPTLAVQFNQPVDPATVSPSDLTLSRGTVTAASVSSDGLTVTFALGGLTTNGSLTATLTAGAVAKPNGLPLRTTFSANYTVDLSTLPLPTPFTPLVPAGSLAYAAPSVADAIYTVGDAHWYTVPLDAGQRLTAVTTAAAGLQALMAVVDPSGNVLTSSAATAPGQTISVQSVAVATAGTYSIVIAGGASTIGTYALNVMLNAASEAQGIGGAVHSTIATAQNLDGAFTSVGGAGSEATVAGTVQSTTGSSSATFTDTFESGLGEFTLDNTVALGLWHVSTGRGAQSGHSASQSLYFGTGETAAGGGTYNTGARTAGNATSPAITLPATASSLTFNYVLQTEGNTTYDKAQVQISTDGGATYTTLASYNGVAESTVWKGATVSLSAYAGKTVQLRWSFDTVDSALNSYEGWYVDDVSVAPSTTQTPVAAVYAFTLNAGDTTSLGLKATGSSAASDVQLLDAAGNVIAQYAGSATGLDKSIADFVAPVAGTYYARVTGTVGAGYDLVITKDATFDTAASAGTAVAQPVAARQVSGNQRVVGHINAGVTDTYAVTLAAGGTLSLSTSTPGDGAGQPVNTLDPRLQLLNSAGTVVATNDNGAADGRNATLNYAVPSAGTYYVVVSSTTTAVTSGDYVLAVGGATPVAPALSVTSITPAKGATLGVAPTQVTVTFSAPFDVRTLSPSLLTIDGVPATAVTQTSATTVTFTVAAVTTQGSHTLAIAGGLTSLRGGVLAAYSGSFTLDNIAPTVIATSIANGATVAAGALTFTATFSEPMLASNLDASDVTLVGQLYGTSLTPSSIAFSANNTVLTVTYASVAEDLYTLTLLTGAGRFQDASGNSMAANYAVSFGVDAATRAVPLLTSVNPLGSLAYYGLSTGAITSATDTDAFTVSLTAGQTITIVDQPVTTTLIPSVTLAAPGGGTLALAYATVAGKTVLVQSVVAPTTGTYTVTVGGQSGTTGKYSVAFYLNSAVESESYGGPVDDTPATAQDITPTIRPVPGAAAGTSVGAVVGTIDTVSADDYAVTLTAGTSNTFSVSGSGGTFALTVTDAAGNVLATGATATGTYSASQVSNFVPAATGTYYLRITSTYSTGYTLVATTGVLFEADQNFGTTVAQSIDPIEAVLGGLGNANDVDLYQFAAVAGADVTLSTITPGPGDILGVRVQVYGPTGVLVADNYGGAADGRNALLTFTAATTGQYSARVSPYSTGQVSTATYGEYLLTVAANKYPAPRPLAPDLLAAADTGFSNADNITSFNDATAGTALQFSIGGTVAGDTVELFIDGSKVGSAVATDTTTTITATAGTILADGTHTVTARQVDPTAGESIDSPALAITVKTATPTTPTAPILQTASDSGTVGDGITNVTTPAFTVAVSTPYFRFYVNGTLVSATYATGTTFTVPTALAPGTYTFSVVAVDAAGNASASSSATTVTILAPTAPPTGLALDPGSDTGISSTDGITSKSNLTFDVTAAGPGTLHLIADGNAATAVTVPVSAAGPTTIPFTYPGAFTGYAAGTSIAVGTYAETSVPADVNGDGLTDLVLGYESQAGVSIMLGNGDGTFRQGATLSITTGIVFGLAVTDLNGDGKADVIAATSAAGIQVFMGNGNGTFSGPTIVATGNPAYTVITGDFNGDGRPDIATVMAGVVQVVLNLTGTTFAAPVTVVTPGTPYMLAAGDLNGDGRADLVVSNQSGNVVSTVLSTGNGTFAAATTLATLNVATGVAIGDLNGDGVPDVVLGAGSGATITPFLGKGDGTFTAGTAIAAGYGLQDIVLTDLNGDGKLDAAVENNAGGATGTSYFLGTGTGTFAARQIASTVTGTSSVDGLHAGDFNGDGRPDLTYALFGGGSVPVLLATSTSLADGTHTFAVWETDSAGNSSPTVSTTVTLDRVAPSLPSAPTLTAASDSGATDGITNVTTPAFTVAGGGPYYRVYRNGTLVSDPYATGTTFTSVSLADGSYTFTVVAVDAAGNASVTSAATVVTIDTTAPGLTGTPVLDASSDSGVSSTDGLTNAATLSIHVTATEAGTLHLDPDGAAGTGPTLAVTAPGTYTFNVPTAMLTTGFAAEQKVTVNGNTPVTTAIADLNGDGVPDMVVAVEGTKSINVLLGVGGGAFASPIVIPVTGNSPVPYALQLADVNGDGKLDLMVGTYNPGVSVFLGNGDGTFVPTVQLVTPTTVYRVVAADFNNDGRPDLMAMTGTGLFEFLSTGPGTFAAGGALASSPSSINAMAVADLNGDGRPDIALTYSGSTVGVMYSTGAAAGAFAAPVALGTTSGGGGNIAVGDLNGDGLPDVVATSYSGNSIVVYMGTGVGTFAAGVTVATGYAPREVQLADVTGDGKLDAVAINDISPSYTVSVLPGNGNGTFGTRVAYPVTGGELYGLSFADLNGDGRTDIALANAGSNNVAILYATGTGLADGAHTFRAWESDVAGNTSPTSAPLTVTLDHKAPPVPPAPSLPANGDTGVSTSDGVTSINAPALTVSGGGPYQPVYRNGTLVSDAYATGTTFASAALADGTYTFAVVAVDGAGNASAAGAVAVVRIDTTAPTATLGPVTAAAGVASVPITFSEPVYGLTAARFTLSRSGGANLLDGTQTLTTTDNIHFTLGNLSKFDAGAGLYAISLQPSSTVTDLAGNALAASASASWSVGGSLFATADGQAFYVRMDPTDSAVQVWQTATPADPTGGAPTFTIAAASFQSTAIAGGGYANITVTVDESNGPIPTSAATFFDGGTGASGDTLIVHLAPGGVTAGVGPGQVGMEVGTTATWIAVNYSHVASAIVIGTAATDSIQFNGVPTSTVTYDGGGGGDTIFVDGSTVSLVGGTFGQLQVNTGLATLLPGPAGGGIQVVHFAGLQVNGGTFKVATAAAAADRTLMVVGTLGLSGVSQFDLGANDMVVNATTLAYLASIATTGYAGGTWAGHGLASSAAAIDPMHLHAIGVVGNVASDGTSALNTTFDGQSVVATDVLVSYTYYGDINLDGVVDVADYTRIDAGFLAGLKGWANGDLNGDGVVDGSDYTLMDNAFNMQPPAAMAAPAATLASPTPIADLAVSSTTYPAATRSIPPASATSDDSDDRLKHKLASNAGTGVSAADAAVDAAVGRGPTPN